MKKATPPKIKNARLKSIEDVRRYLARLINETRTGAVEPGLASKLGYLLNILSGCIKDSEIEQRLEALERRLSE